MNNRLAGLEPARVFRFFEEICQIPHGSGNTKALSDYCKEQAGRMGLECVQDELNNIIIKKPAAPGYEKAPAVMIQGHLDMVHGEKEKVSLEPYEVDHFDGGVPTVSYGKVVDFNLMLKNGAGGRMEALCLDKGEEKRIQPEGRENFLAIYVKEGEIRIGDKNIKAQELGVIKDWKTELQIRSRAEKNSKLGICRAEI